MKKQIIILIIAILITSYFINESEQEQKTLKSIKITLKINNYDTRTIQS